MLAVLPETVAVGPALPVTDALASAVPAGAVSVTARVEPYANGPSRSVQAVPPADGIVMLAAEVVAVPRKPWPATPLIDSGITAPAAAPALQTLTGTGAASTFVKVTTLAPLTALNETVPAARLVVSPAFPPFRSMADSIAPTVGPSAIEIVEPGMTEPISTQPGLPAGPAGIVA